MIIVHKRSKQSKIGELTTGDVFNYENITYIKTNASTKHPERVACVRLINGKVEEFSYDVRVTLAEVELHIVR